MPLEDLRDLGYDVFMPDPEQTLPTGPSVYGFAKQWNLPYSWVAGDDDEVRVISEATNHKKLYDKMTQALTYFQDNYANWASMNNAQKDAANRQAQRGLANLIRHVRGDLTTEGI